MKLLATILVLLQNPPSPRGHGHHCHCGNCPMTAPIGYWLPAALILTTLVIGTYYLYKKNEDENN